MCVGTKIESRVRVVGLVRRVVIVEVKEKLFGRNVRRRSNGVSSGVGICMGIWCGAGPSRDRPIHPAPGPNSIAIGVRA